MTKIAITGAEGQLGRELCRLWGTQAVGWGRKQCDVADRAAVRRAVEDLRPRVVVHCAAYTLVDKAEACPADCMAVNAEGTRHLAEACRDHGAALVYISSDYVFGADASRRTPYRETDTPGPQGVYARSKLAGEVAAAACEQHLVIRTCGLYGHGGHNFVETMLRLATASKSLRVVNDQHCSPTSVTDLALAIRFLVETDARGLLHVVNKGATTWYDFARRIFAVAGLSPAIEPITTAEYNAPAARPANSVLDTGKYDRLGGPAIPSVDEAVGNYIAARGQRT